MMKSMTNLDTGITKDFKLAILNMFKELKEIISKELKERITTSHQIQNTYSWR